MNNNNNKENNIIIGTQLISLRGEEDYDENEQPRTAAPGALGIVTSVNFSDEHQMSIYGVEFPESGVWVYLYNTKQLWAKSP